MDKGEPPGLPNLNRMGIGILELLAFQYNRRAMAFGRRHLRDWGGARHHDRHGNAEAASMIGKPLRVISGRCRSEEHTSELQSLMRISYAVFCLKKKNT